MTHIIVIICSTAHCFNLIDFQLDTDFPSQFYVVIVKSPSFTQRLVSQENAFKKSKNPVVRVWFRQINDQIIIDQELQHNNNNNNNNNDNNNNNNNNNNNDNNETSKE